MIEELNRVLFAADDTKIQTTRKGELATELQTALTVGAKTPVASAEASLKSSEKGTESTQTQREYISRKIEVLHRNIMRYKSLFQRMTELADGPAFLLLDDLYQIRPT
jgi:hypothetical protein